MLEILLAEMPCMDEAVFQRRLFHQDFVSRCVFQPIVDLVQPYSSQPRRRRHVRHIMKGVVQGPEADFKLRTDFQESDCPGQITGDHV